MKKNLGSLDRITRLIIVALMASLYFTEIVTGLLASILLVGSGVLLLTSLTGWCIFYAILGINTCPSKKFIS